MGIQSYLVPSTGFRLFSFEQPDVLVRIDVAPAHSTDTSFAVPQLNHIASSDAPKRPVLPILSVLLKDSSYPRMRLKMLAVVEIFLG